MNDRIDRILHVVESLAARIDRIVPKKQKIDWSMTFAATWCIDNYGSSFNPVEHPDPIRLTDLLEIERQKIALKDNTSQFCRGFPANNALLWGARGTGKSSLIHGLLNEFSGEGLRLVEVDKRSLSDIAQLAQELKDLRYRFIVVCDDLSFDQSDTGYKELKSALEGTVFSTVENLLVYVTSNRRHLTSEFAAENTERFRRELHGEETVEEKISLSDRFGLWLSFHPFSQQQYLDVAWYWINQLSELHGVEVEWNKAVQQDALRWALNRGGRSGRTANHFAKSHVGKKLLEEETKSAE